MQNELFDLYWINVKFIEEISYCVQAIRQQNYHLMRVQMPKVIQIMTEWLQLLEKEDIKKQLSQLVDRDVIVDTLQQIERALQAEDYIPWRYTKKGESIICTVIIIQYQKPGCSRNGYMM